MGNETPVGKVMTSFGGSATGYTRPQKPAAQQAQNQNHKQNQEAAATAPAYNPNYNQNYGKQKYGKQG